MTDETHVARLLAEWPEFDRLPSPGPVVLRLTELASRPDVSLAEFVRTLKSDAGLTGRLLRFANSAAFQRRRHVASVDDAVVRVGLDAVRRLALAFSVLESNRTGPCTAFDYRSHWSRSLACAIVAEQFAKRRPLAPPEDCFTLGLLADVGTLALATLRPLDYAELLARGLPDEEARTRAEFEAFGVSHRDLTEVLLLDWRLPPVLVGAAAGTSAAAGADPSRHAALSTLFEVAKCVAQACMDGAVTLLDGALADRLALTRAEFDECVEIATVQWAGWRRDLLLDS